MKTRLLGSLLLSLLICVVAPARTEAAERGSSPSPDQQSPEVAGGDAFVSVIKQHTGEPILAINYPWKRHARPSVEVRVLEPSEVDNPLIRPLFFVHDLMKGNITKAVYQCQDDSEDLDQTAVFSKDRMDFEIFGARNSLGRPSVCVACKNPPRVPEETLRLLDELEIDEGMPLPETWAIFSLLDAWAVDQRTLYLELPAEYFSRPSKIRVWLLRQKDVVWTATADWPGNPGAAGTPE